ncbi:MAG: aminopeptidase [Ruminococcaceae bacterium]|nr:aminopeptidase [Oscillospiraceae bacterium]
MKKTAMKKYAALIVRKGANVQKKQPVVIVAELDNPEFIRMVVEEAYRAGASEVEVEWVYQPLTKIHTRWQSQKVLGTVKDWEEMKLKYRANTLPAVIRIISEDPDGLAGINQQKRAKAMQSKYIVTKPITDTMENKYQWCIAAIPGPAWAKKVFPELSTSRAIEKLWEAILHTSRADGDDPIAAWDEHNAELAARCKFLNSLKLTELHYKAPNGTDLKVGLIPEGMFLGGRDMVPDTGVYYNPNIPSEEIFTSPMAGKAEGIVYSTKPFSYRGQLIEDFSIKFENGRATEVHAEKNEEALRTMISMDEGAAMLGECALVPHKSPISELGIMFYNTLFDENAACHLALGMGFSNCIRDYEKYTLEECRSMGINDSMIHEDFMIGYEGLEIEGIDANGKVTKIISGGNWAF